MKRLLASFVFALFVLAVIASAQSLGDIAREQRAKKPAPSPGGKVYTNDTISSGTSVASSGETKAAESTATASTETASSSASESDSASSAEERAKAEAEWKGKFAEQRKVIAGLERELDVLNRENKLRAASYYADAGNRLRDEKKYAEDDRRYKAEIATKEQELTAAKQRFEELQEQARKAGMPSRVSDE